MIMRAPGKLLAGRGPPRITPAAGRLRRASRHRAYLLHSASCIVHRGDATPAAPPVRRGQNKFMSKSRDLNTLHFHIYWLTFFFGASFCFSFSSQGASSCADQPLVWAGPRRVLLGWVLMAECCLLPVRRIIPGDYRSPQSISREPAGERCQRFRFCSIFTAQNERRGATI